MTTFSDLYDLPGVPIVMNCAGGAISMRTSGQGAPMLLIHSVNAAPSTAEVAPLHRHYEHHRTVFSLDLPGFGESDRTDRDYTPRVMVDAIHDAVAEIQRRCGAVPIDALALSLSSEFLARAAVEHPTDYRSLAFVSPTGFNGTRPRRGPVESTLGLPWLLRMLRGLGWGRMLFKGLTRPSVIRFFLQKTWGSRQIDNGLWAQAIRTSRIDGAEHAPLHFISGYLFSNDIDNIYDQLRLPIWMTHGTRGDFTDYRKKSRLKTHANWRVSVFSTGALPHFEMLERFCDEYDRFLRDSGNAI